jgi:hypothetical protein
VDIQAELWLPGNAGQEDATVAEAHRVVQAMFVPSEDYRHIPTQKIGGAFYLARLSRWLMDIEHVFNVVIVSPAEDVEAAAYELIERGAVSISVRRVDV